VTLAAHGFSKFSGPEGLAGTAGMFESIGFKPGALNARLAATPEVAAGLGLAVGLLTPLSAAGFVALMLVAAWTVHRSNGFFVTQSGWEYNFVRAAAAVGVATLTRPDQPGLAAVRRHRLLRVPARLVGPADLGRGGTPRRNCSDDGLLPAKGTGLTTTRPPN
jgi:uncharacterized membrane protein YphA (DoxX/SURF4 family)